LCVLMGSLYASSSAHAKYASIVIEAQSGDILHAVNPYKKFHPASMTKLMTLYMTFDAIKKGRLDIEKKVPVSAHAARQPATKLYLQEGDTAKVRSLILSLITRSANDASVVLAEAVSGTEKEFARAMTQKAYSLGMSSTQFYNASGLHHKDQVSTPRDMSLLVRRLMTDFPEYYHMFSTKDFEFRGTTIRNHNTFLKNYPGADGLKTGYINASGYNLAASAVKDGRRLISIIFGGLDKDWRDQHMTKLMDYGFYKATQMAQRREKREERQRAVFEARLPDRSRSSASLSLSQPVSAGSF